MNREGEKREREIKNYRVSEREREMEGDGERWDKGEEREETS